jgi:two-component system chemotaxis response regulator CheY
MSVRIVVVDDSAIVRAMVKKALGMAGLRVDAAHEAASGLEALALLAREPVDAVFTDLNMPEMSGVELVERMAADPRLAAVPVVVISSDRSAARAEQLRARGVRAWISKPFRPEELRAVVQQLFPDPPGGRP